MSSMGQPRPAHSDFGQPHDGSASKPDVACSLGITGPASWSSSLTQEDDHGYSSASDSLNAATRALEQGQAHRPEATSVPDCRLRGGRETWQCSIWRLTASC